MKELLKDFVIRDFSRMVSVRVMALSFLNYIPGILPLLSRAFYCLELVRMEVGFPWK